MQKHLLYVMVALFTQYYTDEMLNIMSMKNFNSQQTSKEVKSDLQEILTMICIFID